MLVNGHQIHSASTSSAGRVNFESSGYNCCLFAYGQTGTGQGAPGHVWSFGPMAKPIQTIQNQRDPLLVEAPCLALAGRPTRCTVIGKAKSIADYYHGWPKVWGVQGPFFAGQPGDGKKRAW